MLILENQTVLIMYADDLPSGSNPDGMTNDELLEHVFDKVWDATFKASLVLFRGRKSVRILKMRFGNLQGGIV